MAGIKGDLNEDGQVNAKDNKLKDQDLNNDGYVNKKDETFRKDTISNDILKVDYRFAYNIVNQNSEIREKFDEAVKYGYSKEKFMQSLQNTKWYLGQESEYSRVAWFAKARGGNDWLEQMTTARDNITRAATQVGAAIPAGQLDTWAERYLSSGWGETDGSRNGLMLDALAGYIDAEKGTSAVVTQRLKTLARANGVTMSDDWFTSTARGIASGDLSEAEQAKYIRDEAAKRSPLYAQQIKAGVNLRDLASPYLTRMSDRWELGSADEISLDDPLIKQAIGQVNEKGEPVSMNYSEFDELLRKDPKWGKTREGMNATMDLATSMARSWGFVTDGT